MLSIALPAFTYDFFAEGKRLFSENKLLEAAPLLYQASLLTGTDPQVFELLGLCYYKAGKYADAISIFMKGTSVLGTDRKTLFLNAGMAFYTQKMYTEAETMFSRSIEIDSAHATSFLYRANTRLELKRFPDAISDYTVYLTLDPASSQEGPIRQLISVLSGEIKDREAVAIKSEAEKAATEAQKKAAAERYQKLLDEVNSSLQAVDGASTLSAGSEDIMEYNEEGQLE